MERLDAESSREREGKEKMNLQKLSFELAAFILIVLFFMLLLIDTNLINENPTQLVFLLFVVAVAGWNVVSVVADHIFGKKEGEEKKE